MADATGRGTFATCLTAALMPLNSTMIAVAVPDIARQFHQAPQVVTQALVASYLIVAIALQGPGGKLGDRLGPWRVFSSGQIAIGVGAVVGMVAPTLIVLAVARVLMAAGGALVVPATIALMRLQLPAERRGRAFGSFGAIMAAAAAIGPILGGALVDAFSWQAVFLVNVPVLVTSAVLAASVPRTAPAGAATPFDSVGSVLLTAALVLLVLGAQRTDTAAGVSVAAGLALFVPFTWWEVRAADPVVAFGLFRSLAFTAGSLLIALQNLVMYALVFEIPLVLDHLFHLGAERTGLLLIFLTAAMVTMSPVAGRLVDRWGPRPVAVAGSVLCIAGLVVLAGTTLSDPGQIRLPLALLGLGLGFSNPAAQSASMSAVPQERSGMAAGIGSTMRYIGGVAGIAVLGRLLDLDRGRPQILQQHHAVLAVFTVVLVAGLLCALALPPITRQDGAPLAPPRGRLRRGLRSGP